MDLNRRTLLKVLGLTAAGSVLPGCEREVHRLVPYLLPDDEIVPGVANWYASVCGECDAGCGILVRVMEGRAKKIEGNPDHPVNEGKLCARGQAAVQTLYHPDRLRGPMKREGARGGGRWAPITWDEGLALWIGQLRRHGHGAALLSRPLSGSLHRLCSGFFERLQGTTLYYDPSDRIPVLAAVRASFGMEHLPHIDLAHSDYVLSFGAPLLDQWLSPVLFGVAYGRMRQGRPSMRGRFVQIEPRLSLTAAGADRWVPIRPGTEGLLALGIGALLLDRSSLRGPERDAYRRLYGGYLLDDVARATEVPRGTILTLADEFSRATAPLAIGGGLAAAHTNGTAALTAVYGINGLAGALGKPGGLTWHKPVDFPQGAGAPPLAGEQALVKLAADFDEGRRRLLHLYRSDPLYSCPPCLRLSRLFERAQFVVSFSPFLDESTTMADLILPDHAPLESWGDHVQRGLASRPTLGLQQPVVTPLYDTRAVGDVLLDAAHELGHRPAPATEPGFRGLVRDNWTRFLSGRGNGGEPGWFEAAWIERLQRGGWWNDDGARLSAHPRPVSPAYEPAQFAGDEREFPFWFLPYSSPTLRRDGAHLPWLQELPDPLTTAVWSSWVEINPATARAAGIREKEIVVVRSPFGSIEAPALLVPGVRPDAIAMPIGQGHRAYGRYAANRGVNPLTILAPLFDARSGSLAACGTRVQVSATGTIGRPVLIDQRSTGEGQGLIAIGRMK